MNIVHAKTLCTHYYSISTQHSVGMWYSFHKTYLTKTCPITNNSTATVSITTACTTSIFQSRTGCGIVTIIPTIAYGEFYVMI